MKVRMAVTIAGILLASSAWAQWNIHTIDGTDDAGMNCKVVNDLTGTPHVFYVRHRTGYDPDLIMHGRWTGSGWQLEQVYGQLGIGDIDAAIGRDGKWRLCCYESWDFYLHYVDNVSGVWTSRTLGWAATSGYPTVAITVDTLNVAHIAAYNAVNDVLEHWWHLPAMRDSWRMATIDLGSSIRGVSMTSDGVGRSYVAYYNTGDLKMGRHDSVWGTFTIDQAGDVGDYTSIKVDRSGGVHISYYDATSGDLKYAAGTPSFK